MEAHMLNCSGALLVMSPERSNLLLSQLAGISSSIRAVSSCEEATQQLRDDPAISLILTDVGLPDGTWFDVLNLVGHLHPGARVVVCAPVEDEQLWTSVLEAGGFDALVEPWEPGEVNRIDSPAANAARAGSPARRAAGNEQLPLAEPGIIPRAARLTKREQEIAALVTAGWKNREIGEKLFISEQTVKNHVHHILEKLQISDRLELIAVSTE
jgi:DNA-binding NarL/FixJ family response regulator